MAIFQFAKFRKLFTGLPEGVGFSETNTMLASSLKLRKLAKPLAASVTEKKTMEETTHILRKAMDTVVSPDSNEPY
jgi:hypothetical protein